MRLSLRAKLALVTLILLTIPLVGYWFVQEMDRFLRAGLEQSVAATAKAAAVALHDRPALLERRAPPVRVDAVPTVVAVIVKAEAKEAATGASAEVSAEVTIEAPTPALPTITTHSEPTFVPPPALKAAITPEADPKLEIERIVHALDRAESRMWVVNRRGALLAITGSLKKSDGRASSSIDASKGTTSGLLERAQSNYLQPLYARILGNRILPRASDDFDDTIPAELLSGSQEIARALAGLPATAWRSSVDGRATIISAAHPVWNGPDVVAVVVAEETTNAIRSLTTDSLERLISITLLVFVLAAATLIWFAQRLSSRIIGLAREAENAIDARGRVEKIIASSTAQDEIGDLSRSFSTLLERLGQYNHYLENLAARLSHELRTPIAVVRSSLDNLRMDPQGAQASDYLQRANEGIERLNTILKRMSEASRLEHILKDTQMEEFDLSALLRGCAQGYETVYPGVPFKVDAPPALRMRGAPDLIAQLLDKLVANAVSFSDQSEPVLLALTSGGPLGIPLSGPELSVSNAGPPLPPEAQARLFQSMVSARATATSGAEPHLGLGLYIVRLIAEHHGAQAFAENRSDRLGVRGVRVGVRFTAAAQT